MDEIDLIPASYREHVNKIRILKLFGLVFIGLILTTSVTFASLEYIKRETNSEISKLSDLKVFTARQRENYQNALNEKKELDYQWQLLNGLRTAVVAEDLFVAIDLSIKDIDVQFSSIWFQRSEIGIEGGETQGSGYLIVVMPEDEKQSMAIGASMQIIGEAPNHSTLSSFVNNLIDQDEILDASVLETTTSNSQDSDSVKFKIAITLDLGNQTV